MIPEPSILTEINKSTKNLEQIKGIIRIIPNPPNFNKMAAKIIEPITGASTWALGNHKCPKKIGNFTINAIKELKIIIKLMPWCVINWGNWNQNSNFLLYNILKENIKRGIEAVTV